MRVGILGPLTVETDGRTVELGGTRLRALLVRLALQPGRPVAADTLVAAVWGDDRPDDEANALQSLVSRLRRSLPDPGLVGSGPAGYLLDVAPADVDALRFEQLATAARSAAQAPDAEPGRTLSALTEALALWRGRALADLLAAPFAAGQAARLEELRLAATELRLDALVALGRTAEAVPELEQLVAEHPLREGLAERLVRALHRDGRRAEALQAYERARVRVADELGVDPSPGLRAAQLEVLRADADRTVGRPDDEPAQRPAAGVVQDGAAGAAADAQAPRVPAPGSRAADGEAPEEDRAPQDRQAGRLPVALTSFVGRDEELKAVQDLLGGSRLVTLVGTGGSGKTRLATEVAARLAPTRRDGAWLVELARWSDPADVPQAVLGTISLRTRSLLETAPGTGGDPLARLVDGLSGRDLLLVMDNCEHLVESTAEVVDRLLTRCPGLTVLATSREPLGIGGEVVVPVRPLARPPTGSGLVEALELPSVRLFADRAAAAQQGFAVTADTLPAVVEICRRLDGLPLAIELAAARLRSLPVEAVAARLGDRFRLLTGGSRTAAPRHQTLRAVVAWSWDLLDDEERDLLERLAVFAGGISLDGAVALSGPGADPTEVLDRLSALVERSLLVVSGLTPADLTPAPSTPTAPAAPAPAAAAAVAPRYRMLETIREFGLERLADRDLLQRVRADHAQHFLHLAETAEPWLRRSEQVRWLERLTAERDNLHAAIRFAADTGDADTAVRLGAALAWYWTVVGDHNDAATWLSVATAVPGPAPAQARVTAGMVLGLSLLGGGDVAGSRATVTWVRSLLAELDPASGHPLLALVGAGLAMVDDDHPLALAELEHALGQGHPDPWATASLWMMKAVLAENDGDIETLRAAGPRALAGFREVGDRWGMATSLTTLSALAALDGDLPAALAGFGEVAGMMTELNATDDVIWVLVRMAALHAQLGDRQNARSRAGRAQELAERRGSAWAVASAQMALAQVDRLLGDGASALARAERARVLISSAVGSPPQAGAMVHHGLALIEIEGGRLDRAAEWLVEAAGEALVARDMPVLALVTTGLARLAREHGDAGRTAELVGVATAVRGTRDLGDPEVAALVRWAQDELGEPGFRTAYRRGSELSRPFAVERVETMVRALHG